MIPLIRNNFLLLSALCLLIAACSGTRHLPEGEKLYTGAEVKLESTEKTGSKGMIESAAEGAIRPLPNKGFFGIRPKLWMNNMAGEEPKTKLEKWLKKRGEEPVLLSSVKPAVTSEVIDAKLFNLGIFKSITQSEVKEKKRTAKVIYTSHIHKPYVIKDLLYDIEDDSLSKNILSIKKKSFINPGKNYKLENLKNERTRIDAHLKNNGYFYFSPDYLLFKADTSNADKTVTLTLTLKDSISSNALEVYHINNVYVNQNFSLNQRRARNVQDTVMIRNIVFFGKEERLRIKPRVLSKSVFLRKGERFSRLNHSITLNRLMSMGNFKLVQVNFAAEKDSLPGLLDVNIQLTPMPRRTFRAEIDLVSKSNEYIGPRINLSLLNRNTFRGAELLNLNMAGSFESQWSGGKSSFSYSYNPQVELIFPRFILPFNLKSSNSLYVPKTHILFNYQYLRRVEYFNMRTFRFAFGYKWKENIRKEHELNPIDISYTSIGNRTDSFIAILDDSPFLKRSYEEMFIPGGSYSFTYNEQMLAAKRIQFYLNLRSELAGNSYALYKRITGEKVSSENPSKVTGSVFSQFAKLSLDGRAYINFSSKDKLALRVYGGVAKPYGNSALLPYNKQFFSGGPNSIRAFHINSIGPGTYNQQGNAQGFLQLGGELKLETNIEYRFTIYNFFKGAFFVDAGNVWLLRSNPGTVEDPPGTPAPLGTPFSYSNFRNELAMGAGVGLRIDVSFFILRLDLASPIRKPWQTDNEWVGDEIDFGSKTWRKDNLVLNVAIGYPF
ncbi:MAG TPA: BamA/TamA family outer membrane protein [Prolixibacteraceae bacterium]|nr:BamA/TamA family outer membrane protein [Prolixibacteraceae bacterium]